MEKIKINLVVKLKRFYKEPMSLVGKNEQDVTLAHVVNGHIEKGSLDYFEPVPFIVKNVQYDYDRHVSLEKQGLVKVEGSNVKLTKKGLFLVLSYQSCPRNKKFLKP